MSSTTTYYSDKNTKKQRWSKQGAQAEKARMRALVATLDHKVEEAKRKNHPIHAARMAEIAKQARAEYNRISKLNALNGFGDPGASEPRRFGLLGLAVAGVVGVFLGKAIK